MFAYSTCVTEKYIDRKIEQEANMTILNVNYFWGWKDESSYFLCTFLFWVFPPPSKFLKGKKGIKIF